MISLAGRRVAQTTQRVALRFAEADLDGDNALDWREFLSVQPASLRARHSEDTLHGWFEALDPSSRGTVSIYEFFMWALLKVVIESVDGLRACGGSPRTPAPTPVLRAHTSVHRAPLRGRRSLQRVRRRWLGLGRHERVPARRRQPGLWRSGA
jgi:hypothetical protein